MSDNMEPAAVSGSRNIGVCQKGCAANVLCLYTDIWSELDFKTREKDLQLDA